MPTNNQRKALGASYFSMASNVALALVKGLAGYFGNSYALIADAIESTADVLSSILVFMGLKYTHRPPDKNHPYGHGRAEPLVTFIVVGFLISSAIIIGYSSIINIGTPHQLPEAYTLYILGAIILWKEYSFQLVLRKSKETNSSALKADAWHHRSDAITSVAAFIGISVALVLGKGYEAADDVAALFAAGFIIYNSYKIFRPALGELMDEHVYDKLVQEIKAISVKVPGVIGTEKCLVRKVGVQYQVDLHAIVDENLTVRAGHQIAHQLQDRLKHDIPSLGYVLIHIEPDGEDNYLLANQT
jgi:cation diffusion facilitator family transporter